MSLVMPIVGMLHVTVLLVILMVRVLPVMRWVMVSLTMSVVRVLQALSRVTAMWAASIAWVLKVMLWVMAPLATLTTVSVPRCIGGIAGCVDREGVVGDAECGGVAGEASRGCETGNADVVMGDAGDGRAAEGKRCG